LFLDEVGDLAPASQAALLRVLQEREVVPVGGSQAIPVDFRLVAATHHDLDAKISDGSFRRDLYARLAGFQVELPPLRDRLHELGLLAGTLLHRLAPGRTIELAVDAVRALARHDWPMNVRELERCLATALALAGPAGAIEAAHLQIPPPAPRDAEAALADDDRARRDELIELLRRHGGNVSAVARHLGKARMQIQRWLHRYGIDPDRYRA
jgi:transcriptional regulator of acetoin/glycerol metabolism